jgi:phosphopantothenate---cysteine ligase (CTP)
MRILVTAGSTQVNIDKVRVISNIFRGRTGTNIAAYAATECNHTVTLVGNPESREYVIEEVKKLGRYTLFLNIKFIPYRSFDELEKIMEKEITTNEYDAIIHSAAVSDYKVAVAETDWDTFNVRAKNLYENNDKYVAKGKIPSGRYLFLMMVPTIKLVDKIREPWGFKGQLVKFKLQVDITNERLIEIAKESLAFSKADFIVANKLENFNDWTSQEIYVLDSKDKITICTRYDLAKVVIDKLEGK